MAQVNQKNWYILTLTEVFLNQNWIGVCEHMVKMAPLPPHDVDKITLHVREVEGIKEGKVGQKCGLLAQLYSIGQSV